MAELIVSIQAYCKILLHAVKHPHCAVNGVLLAEDNKSKDRKVLKFVDCVDFVSFNFESVAHAGSCPVTGINAVLSVYIFFKCVL